MMTLGSIMFDIVGAWTDYLGQSSSIDDAALLTSSLTEDNNGPSSTAVQPQICIPPEGRV
jgi:hypothetical protein